MLRYPINADDEAYVELRLKRLLVNLMCTNVEFLAVDHVCCRDNRLCNDGNLFFILFVMR